MELGAAQERPSATGSRLDEFSPLLFSSSFLFRWGCKRYHSLVVLHTEMQLSGILNTIELSLRIHAHRLFSNSSLHLQQQDVSFDQ